MEQTHMDIWYKSLWPFAKTYVVAVGSFSYG